MRLCAAHGEGCRLTMQWKWHSLGILVVGRVPNPGTYICLSHHARARNNHPTLIDDAEINRSYKVDSYNKVSQGQTRCNGKAKTHTSTLVPSTQRL